MSLFFVHPEKRKEKKGETVLRREFRVFETNKNKKKLSFFLVLPLYKGKEVSLSLSVSKKFITKKL